MKNKPYVLAGEYPYGKTGSVWMTGHAMLMCPKCYRLYKVSTDGHIKVAAEDSDTICDIIVHPVIHAECPCGFLGNMIMLDDLIAGAVSVLNQLGYKTVMSCCSHEGEYDNRLFIKFAEEYSFVSLPDGWQQSENKLFIESHLPREKALDNIYRWLYDLVKVSSGR